MNFYQLEPEVAGGWGQDTVVDTTVHPPVVSFLHYEFAGWLGDHLLESFPCFVVSDVLGARLVAEGVSGFHVEPAKITTGEDFYRLSSGANLPKFDRLVVTGASGVDDLGLLADASLVVSESCLQILKKWGLTHCEIRSFVGE